MKREQASELAASLTVEVLSRLNSAILVEILVVMQWNAFCDNCRKIG